MHFVIEVKNLTKVYEYYEKDLGLKNSIANLVFRKKLYKEAVKGISFGIEKGEIIGFIGANGAGKTTTLKMLSGILYPTSGEARVLGYKPWERKKEFKKLFSLVSGQKNQLWWDLPANESLYLNKCIYEIDNVEYGKTLDELTEMLDVKDLLKVQVRRLSLGERMKMELIAALIHKPEVIFLDEPTIGLDILSQKIIRDFLKNYNQQRKATIILTSHYIADIEELSKRSIIINNGSIIYDGGLSDISTKINNKKIIKLNFSEQVDKVTLGKYGILKKFDGSSATIETEREKVNTFAKEILDRLPVLDFNVENISIEEDIAILFKGGNDA